MFNRNQNVYLSLAVIGECLRVGFVSCLDVLCFHMLILSLAKSSDKIYFYKKFPFLVLRLCFLKASGLQT